MVRKDLLVRMGPLGHDEQSVVMVIIWKEWVENFVCMLLNDDISWSGSSVCFVLCLNQPQWSTATWTLSDLDTCFAVGFPVRSILFVSWMEIGPELF
jgi:hypothetical protein